MAASVEIARCKAGNCVNAGDEYCVVDINVINSDGKCEGSIIISTLFSCGTEVKATINKCFCRICVYYHDNKKCGSKWIPYINEDGKCSQFLKQYIPVAPIFIPSGPAAA